MLRDWIIGICAFVLGWPFANAYGIFGYIGLIFFSLIIVTIYQWFYHTRFFERRQQRREHKLLMAMATASHEQLDRADADPDQKKRAITEESRTTTYKLPTLEQFIADIGTHDPVSRISLVNAPTNDVTLANIYKWRFGDLDRTTHSVASAQSMY